MLCSGENPILKIIGVEYMRWSGGVFSVRPRAYSALAFRIRGSASILCGGGEYNVNVSDVLYLPQNMEYTADYTDTEMIVIHFKALRDDKEIEVYPFQNGEQLYKLFLRALTVWENKEPGYTVYAMAQLYSILGSLQESEAKTKLPEYFLSAVSYINANYKDSTLSAQKICENAGISSTNLRLLFKKYYQKTPTSYITELRLEYARNLISCGEPIESAAEKSGFNDPKYFARVVKKHFSCTPRELKLYGR